MDKSNYKISTIIYLGFIIIGVIIILWEIFSLPVELKYTDTSDEIINVTKNVISKIDDPVIPKINMYPEYPAEGKNIGSISIPALKRKISLYNGTRNSELSKGAGHFIQSALPGEEENCVISGHSQTVFRKLDTLKCGDLIIVQTSAGKFTYEISKMQIVKEDDKTVIVTIDHGALTLTTCYPFNYIGDQSYRYIVTADLVKSELTKK